MVIADSRVITTGRGLDMEFQPADRVMSETVAARGEWEEDVAKAIEKFLKPGWTFLDIGSNVGYFSLIAAQRGHDVIAVDADPEACALLSRNAARNGFSDRITVVCSALDGSSGGALLSTDDGDNPGARHLSNDGDAVRTDRLIDVLGDKRPEMIKIDIEGKEYDALSAAPEILESAQVIIFEAGGHSTRYGVDPQAIVRLLEDSGFVVTYMNGAPVDGQWVSALADMPDAYINMIARRNPEAAVRTTVLLCAWRNMVIETVESLLALRDAGWGYAIARGDALIARSRSRAVTNWYMHTDEDVFLMIDDDVVFTVEHAEKVVSLAKEKRSIAIGAYPVKDGGHLACRRLPGQEIMFSPYSEPVEIMYPATGFMAVHRDVITAMVDAKNADGSPRFPLCGTGPGSMYPFFDTFAVVGEDGVGDYLSEDYAFGEQARRLGFKVWLDPSVILYHIGQFPYNVHDMKNVKRVS